MLGGLQRVFGRYVVVNEAVSAARWRGARRSEVQGVVILLPEQLSAV